MGNDPRQDIQTHFDNIYLGYNYPLIILTNRLNVKLNITLYNMSNMKYSQTNFM